MAEVGRISWSPDYRTMTERARTEGDPHTLRCPECGEYGTHAGSCDLGLMRSGRSWHIVAIPPGAVIQYHRVYLSPPETETTE